MLWFFQSKKKFFLIFVAAFSVFSFWLVDFSSAQQFSSVYDCAKYYCTKEDPCDEKYIRNILFADCEQKVGIIFSGDNRENVIIDVLSYLKSLGALRSDTIFEIRPVSGQAGVNSQVQFNVFYDPDGKVGPLPEQNLTKTSDWRSDNETVALISVGGLATCKKAGTANISAGGLRYTAYASLTCGEAAAPSSVINDFIACAKKYCPTKDGRQCDDNYFNTEIMRVCLGEQAPLELTAAEVQTIKQQLLSSGALAVPVAPSQPGASGAPAAPGATCDPNSNQLCNPLQAENFGDLINIIINFLFWIAIVAGPLMILVAAFMFLTSGGNTNKIATAKNIILYTSVGIAVALLAKGLISVIKSVFNG